MNMTESTVQISHLLLFRIYEIRFKCLWFWRWLSRAISPYCRLIQKVVRFQSNNSFFSAPKRIPDAELNAMISDSMKDINSDEELSGDENDPDLLV